MNASAMNPRNSQHVRSKSVPTNPHPALTQVDEQLNRLRASEATSSSLGLRLDALQDLHGSVDKLLLLPLSQQALVKEVLDDLQEGSLRLLDLCDIAKNALLQTRECTHELASIFRRRRSDNIGASSSLKKCLSSRKMVKKSIHKVLKGMESKAPNKDHGSLSIVRQIKEVEAVTYHCIEALLFFIAGPKLVSKWSCWASFSKLVQPKRVACISEGTNISVIERLDLILSSITNHQTEVEDMQNLVRECGASIKEVDEELEGLYRFIIKTRVSLLNIFNY